MARKADITAAATLRRLFPGPRLVPRLMAALNRGRTSVEDIVAGRNVPHEIALVAELLAACPVQAWPQRWATCAGIGASRKTLILGKIAAGVPIAVIASDLGVSREHVYRLRKSHNLNAMPAVRERRGRPSTLRTWCIGAVAALQETGVTDGEIVRAVGCGCTGPAIRAARQVRLIAPRYTRTLVTDQMRDEIVRMWQAGRSRSEIASLTGLRYHVVYRTIRNSGNVAPIR